MIIKILGKSKLSIMSMYLALVRTKIEKMNARNAMKSASNNDKKSGASLVDLQSEQLLKKQKHLDSSLNHNKRLKLDSVDLSLSDPLPAFEEFEDYFDCKKFMFIIRIICFFKSFFD